MLLRVIVHLGQEGADSWFRLLLGHESLVLQHDHPQIGQRQGHPVTDEIDETDLAVIVRLQPVDHRHLVAIGEADIGDIASWNPLETQIKATVIPTYTRNYPLFRRLYEQTKDIATLLSE